MKWNIEFWYSAFVFGAMVLQTVSSRIIINREGEALKQEDREVGEVAEAIETTILRLIIAPGNQEQAIQRQDDDGDEDGLGAVTPIPSVLPQVAQIIGAFFQRGLNISRGVPKLVSNRFQGFVKFLGGENAMLKQTTPGPSNTKNPHTIEKVPTVVPLIELSTSVIPSTLATTTRKGQYKIRPSTKEPLLVDDEFERFERAVATGALLVGDKSHS